MIYIETHHFRGNQARRWRSLITLTLIVWSLTPLVFYSQTVEAETTPSTLRSQADYLMHAVERCQQRLNSGELDECTVIVRWDNNREISMEEAEAYAARLKKSACISEAGSQSSSKKTQVRCAKRVEKLVRGYGYNITEKTTNCLASLGALYIKRGEKLFTLAAVNTCSGAAILSTKVLDEVVDEQNSCFDEALEKQKQDIESCKK